MLLVIALATAATIAPIAPAVAVELLVVLSATVVAVSALVPAALVAVVVAMIAMLAMVARTLIMLAKFSRRTLLLRLACFARRFGYGRRRRRGCWGVLSRDESHRRRRRVDVVASINWGLRGSVQVRVRLAGRISGRSAVRARAPATTVRASAFGHATLFVMGYVLATSHQHLLECSRGAPVDQEVARKRHASP